MAIPSHRTDDAQLKHTPTTDLIDRIKKETPKAGLITFEKIDKAKALDLLTLNKDNRAMYSMDVEKHARNMRSGKWKFIGPVIRIDKNLRLVDGQHELWAICLSETVQVFHIQCGLEEDAYTVIDTGRVKSIYDALRTAGYKDVFNLGSAIRTVIFIQNYQRIAGTYKGSARVDNLEAISWIKNAANARLCDRSMKYAHTTLHSGEDGDFLTKSAWAAIFYIFAKIDPAVAETFCIKLATGEGLVKDSKDNAIYLLRRKLLWLAKRENRTHGARAKDIRYRYIFHAWNLWRNKKQVTELTPEMTKPGIEKPI